MAFKAYRTQRLHKKGSAEQPACTNELQDRFGPFRDLSSAIQFATTLQNDESDRPLNERPRQQPDSGESTPHVLREQDARNCSYTTDPTGWWAPRCKTASTTAPAHCDKARRRRPRG